MNLRARLKTIAGGPVRRIGILVVAGLTAAVLAPPPAAAQNNDEMRAYAVLQNADGQSTGVLFLSQKAQQRQVMGWARVWNMPPGFHGFHLHQIGECTSPSFQSAGGHYDPTNKPHGQHAGDLPILLVQADGTGYLMFDTDRFTIDELVAGDGTGLIVHAKADNFANIPERYGGPDDKTLANGDAGARLACGIVRRL